MWAKEDSRVDTEFPVVPRDPDNENLSVHNQGPANIEKEKRVRSDISRLSADRPDTEATLEQLRVRIQTERKKLEDFFAGERGIRIERARLNREKDSLRPHVLELKRSRLQKHTDISDMRSRLRKLQEGSDGTSAGEINQLQDRVSDLEGDIAAFIETMEMHRRDRNGVFDKLMSSLEVLQDLLTEMLLARILQVSGKKPENEGRVGPAGVVAELLGRLLILEKESANLDGIVAKNRLSERN